MIIFVIVEPEVKKNPLVSIVMPMHNDGEFTVESINSVLSQTCKDFELLIVDDASTDNSFELANVIQDPRIKIFRNQVPLGAAGARNVALRNAIGKYVAFLDADDVWEPNKLEEQIGFMESNGIRFSCSYYTIMSSGGTPRFLMKAPKSISKRRMFRCCYLGCLTAIYDQTVTGVIQVDERLKKRNDYAIWLQIIDKTGPCVCLEKSLACYRLNENGISSKKTSLLKWHYRLFRWQMHMGPMRSCFYSVLNVFYTLLKKAKYRENYVCGK